MSSYDWASCWRRHNGHLGSYALAANSPVTYLFYLHVAQHALAACAASAEEMEEGISSSVAVVVDDEDGLCWEEEEEMTSYQVPSAHAGPDDSTNTQM